jgi:glycosyltransferase involved in cell wall biosynthesis
MRILIATAYRGVVGGTETYLRNLLPALRDRGHELALLYEHEPPAGMESIDEGCGGIPAWRMGDPGALEAASRWRPSLCYLHALQAPEADEELARRFRTFLFAHNYYGTCAALAKCNGWPSPRPCARPMGLACLGLNYTIGCGFRNPLRLVQTYRAQRKRLRLLDRVAAVLVASRHMAEEYRRNGVPPGRVILAPLFPTASTPLPLPPLRRGLTGELLFCGRFTSLKGGDVLIRAIGEAARKLQRPLSVVFAGDGPARPAWEGLARRSGVSARFEGWCDTARLGELRHSADLLVVPSVWPEPFGLVGVEAGCVGLPAVAFAVGGITDWLRPGESGELAPSPPSAAGLAEAIARALRDPDHHQRLREGAWRVAGTFTLARHVETIEATFERHDPLARA